MQGLRAELAAQNTSVLAVMPGAVDTDMSKDFPPPKMPPQDVASAALDALENGDEEIYPGKWHPVSVNDLPLIRKELKKNLPVTYQVSHSKRLSGDNKIINYHVILVNVLTTKYFLS